MSEVGGFRRSDVEEVERRLAWNVQAYGKAWTGEREDTEFVVGPLLDRLAEERRVRKLLAEALVIAGDALRTCKVEAEADTGDPVWHLPNLIALTVDGPRLRIAAALAESEALDQKTGEA